jgi:hypothetical protein
MNQWFFLFLEELPVPVPPRQTQLKCLSYSYIEVIFILGMNSKRLPGMRQINEYNLGGRACSKCNDYSFCISSLIATHCCLVHPR